MVLQVVLNLNGRNMALTSSLRARVIALPFNRRRLWNGKTLDPVLTSRHHPSGKKAEFLRGCPRAPDFCLVVAVVVGSKNNIARSSIHTEIRPFRKEGLIAFLSINLKLFSEKNQIIQHSTQSSADLERHRNRDDPWPSFDFATEIFCRYASFFGWVLSDVCVSFLLQLYCQTTPHQSPSYYRRHGCLHTMKSRVHVPSLKFRH